MRFSDRRQAGKPLAERLAKHDGRAVVYALPRGGVELGIEVASALDAPLGLLIARKSATRSTPNTPPARSPKPDRWSATKPNGQH